MNNRGNVLALASALSAGEEVTLGPTDMAMCVAALKFYANEHRKAGALRMMKIPALIAAGLIGTMAVGGSSIGNTDVSMMELPAPHFEHFVRRTSNPFRTSRLSRLRLNAWPQLSPMTASRPHPFEKIIARCEAGFFMRSIRGCVSFRPRNWSILDDQEDD